MALLSACTGPSAGDGPLELELADPTVVVSEESTLLALPVDMTVDPDGNLLVLDWTGAKVLVVPPGRAAFSVGRKGEGPGEFQGPSNVGASNGSILVIDQIRGRLLEIDHEGQWLGEITLAVGVFKADIGERFIAYTKASTVPGEPLVTVIDPNGTLLHQVVEPVVPPSSVWDMDAMRQTILRGEVPDEIRNNVLPIVRRDGGLWTVVQTESILQRYAADGTLLVETTLDMPEKAIIIESFREAARDTQRNVVLPLQFVNHAEAVGDDVWLLWNMPRGATSLVTIHGPDGGLRYRLTFPGIPAAGHLAIDVERRWLYLHTVDDSSVVAYEIPDGLIE